MGRSIAARLLTLVGIIAVVLVVAIALLTFAIQRFEQRTDLGRATQPTIELARQVETDLSVAEVSVRAYALTGNRAVLEPFAVASGALPGRSDQLIEAAGLTGQRAQATRLRDDATAFVSGYLERLVQRTASDPAGARRQARTEEGRRRLEALRTETETLIEAIRSTVRDRNEEAEASARRANVFSAGALAVGLLTLLVTALYAAHDIGNPLRRMREAAIRLGGGELDVRVTPEGGHEVREVAGAFNEMAGRLQEGAAALQRRERELRTARDDAALLAQVADEMARAGSPAERAMVLLNRIADLLDAPLGTIYADCEQQGLYTRLAHRGLDPAALPASLDPEGPASLAVREGRPLSGEGLVPGRRAETPTGPAAVRHELHFPLLHGAQRVGVLSLGCTRPRTFEVEEIERIRALAEHGAVVLANSLEVRRREREADLNQAVLDAISDAVLVVGLDDETLMFNPAMDRWWNDVLELPESGAGVPVAELFRQVAERVVDGERLQQWFVEIDQDPLYTGSAEFDLHNGRASVAYVAPVFDASGARMGRIFVSRETTEARQAERAKDELIATVSHELRTPLSAILGFTELLRARDYPREERAEYLDTVHEQAERLVGLVNDFLDLRRLRDPSDRVRHAPVDLRALLEEQTALFAGQSTRHRVRLEGDGGDLRIEADAAGLQRAVANLISNAIKYSPDGGEIRVAAERGDRHVRICVYDEGIGVPDEFKEKVFDRFFRVDSSATRRIGGTGLGLALVREIAEAHGGSVGFESVEGQGSRFWLLLPVRERPDAAQ